MKCYLHVGTEKTGTSTIQKFLELNKRQLLNKGLIFTTSAGRTNNRKLATACFSSTRRDNATRRDGIKTDDDLQKLRATVINDLINEIGTAKGNGDESIIFSSEHFHSRLTTTDEVLRLKETLHLLGASKIKVIIYLRNPADFASSLFSTQIKAGSTLEQPPSPEDIKYRIYCDHRETLQRYSEVFGKENISPRLFQKDELKNGSIIDDFAHLIDFPINTPEIKIPKNENESLSANALEILRRLNKIIPPFANGLENSNRKNLTAVIARNFQGRKYSISPALRAQYEEAFKASNEWVRSNYFPEKITLFSSTSSIENKPSIESDDLDKIANLIGEMWLNGSQQDSKKPGTNYT